MTPPLVRSLPRLGHGVGLRVPHYQRALEGRLEVDWVEVISENFFGAGGRPRAVLAALRRERPLVFHGVGLGIGSLGPPEREYLARLRELSDAFEPAWVSDHVCWTYFSGWHGHELLPLPFTEEALAVAVDNTLRAQDALGRPLVLENVSSYVSYAQSEMSEWEFLSELTRRSGCSLLLDLNNVLVSAHNHGFSPAEYLRGVPPERVVQFHLANHSRRGDCRFDDHRGPVPDEVWALFEAACWRFGPVSSLVEWDEDVPEWSVLVAERDEAARRALAVAEMRQRGEAEIPMPFEARGVEREPARRSGALRRGELERAQRLFFRAVTWPRGVRHFVSAGDDALRAELGRTFVDPVESDALGRLELYADGYFYRLLAAASEIFPRLALLAGPAPWHDLITDYVLACPPDAPDLRRVGQRLPAYLQRHRLGQAHPLLVELAQLELALAHALDAADAEPLRRDTLAALPAACWPELSFRVVPSAVLLRAEHDLEEVAALCAAGERERALAVGPEKASLGMLAWRRGHAAELRRLDPFETLALEHIERGARFEQVCALAAELGLGSASIGAQLERWIDDGLLRAFPSGASAG